RVEASKLVHRQADADTAVDDPDRRGGRTGGAHGSLHLEPDLHAVRGREAVRDDRRLEGDNRLLLVERAADLVRDLDQLVHAADGIGIAPTCWTQRAAASSARSGPPTIQPAASASPAPVESRIRSTGSASRSTPSNEQPRAPRLTIQTASTDERPTRRSSSSFAKTTSGARVRTASRNASSPLSRIALHDERSTLARDPWSRASSTARSAAVRTGSTMSA